MPLRGESIGTAYVKVLADGTGLGDSIEDMFEGERGRFEADGRERGAAWRRGFGEGMEDGPDFDGLNDALDKAIVQSDLANDYFESDDWHRFRTRLKTEFGIVGAHAADDLSDGFRRRGSIVGLENEMDNIFTRLSRSTDRLRAEQLRRVAETERVMKDFGTRLRTAIDEDEDHFGIAARRMAAAIDEVDTSANRAAINGNFLSRTIDEMRRVFSRNRTEVDHNRSTFTLFGRDLDRMGDGISRVFGRGSRSELLNFFGVLTRNIFLVIAAIPKFIGKILEIPAAFKEARKSGEGVFSSIIISLGNTEIAATAATASVAELGVTGPIALIALAAAAAVAVIAISPIASLVMGIVGALTALTSTIAFGLLGAIVPLIGLVPVLGAGILGLVTAVVGLKDRSKELTAAVKPLRDEFKGLADDVADILLGPLDGQMKRLADNLGSSEPLVRGIARAMSDAFDSLIAVTDSKAWDLFIRDMTKFLPDAIRSLGRIAGNSVQGLTGLFRAAIPGAEEFLGWLEEITGKWAEFANMGDTIPTFDIEKATGPMNTSPFLVKEKNPLRVFFEDALESARTLFDFLGSLKGLLDTIITGGKETGDTLFGDLTDKLDEWNTFLQSKEGQRAMEDFFTNAEEVARGIGKIATAIGDVASSFDTPGGRFLLAVFMGTFASGLTLTAEAVDFFTDKMEGLVEAIKDFKDEIDFDFSIPGLSGLLEKLNPSGGSGRGAFVLPIPDFSKFFARFDSIGPRISEALARGRSAASRGIDQIVGFFTSLPGRIGAIIGRLGSTIGRIVNTLVPPTSPIGNALRTIVGFFSGLGERIASATAGLAAIIARIVAKLTIVVPRPRLSGGGGGGSNQAPGPVDPSKPDKGGYADYSARTMASMGGLERAGGTFSTFAITIITPTKDPEAVAMETMNRLVAAGF